MNLLKQKYKLFKFFPFLALAIFFFNVKSAEANLISKFFKQRLQEMLAPKSQLWEKWKKRNPQNKKRISHKLWKEVLAKNLFLDVLDLTFTSLTFFVILRLIFFIED